MSVTECGWPECNSVIPPKRWACTKHYMLLPSKLRASIHLAENDYTARMVAHAEALAWATEQLAGPPITRTQKRIADVDPKAEEKYEKRRGAPGRPARELGTPTAVLELARQYMGGVIQFDPCSTEIWNESIGASTFLSEQGEAADWASGAYVFAPQRQRQEFWTRLVEHWSDNQDFVAVWFGTMEDFGAIHAMPFPVYSPLEWRTRFLREPVELLNEDGTGSTKKVHGYLTFFGIGDVEAEKLIDGITVTRIE